MTEKNEAVEELLTTYRDSYGRVTRFPAHLSDPENGIYDSENHNLWTGEASMLLRLNNLNYPQHFEEADRGFQSVTIEPGLISRHPHPFWEDPNHHKVSWDEYNGLMYHSIAIGDKETPKQVIDYGRKHFWVFMDGNFWGLPFKRLMKVFLGSIRQPRDTFFYKIAAGIKPNLLEIIWAAISHILTSRKPSNVTSGKIMAWFKQKAIEMTGFDHFIWRYAVKVFDKNLKKCYNNEYYMEDVFRIYFPDHPFMTLIKGLK